MPIKDDIRQLADIKQQISQKVILLVLSYAADRQNVTYSTQPNSAPINLAVMTADEGTCPLIHPVLSSRVSRVGRVSRVSRVSRVRVTAYCYH